MKPHGLPAEVACRNKGVIKHLSNLPRKGVDETLGILWKEVEIAESAGINVAQARDDLGWITTSFKLAQFLSS